MRKGIFRKYHSLLGITDTFITYSKRGIQNYTTSNLNLNEEEELKNCFNKMAIGNPGRVKINRIINFLLSSNLLQAKWTHTEIVDEIYKRKIDKTLLFHLHVLYGLGSKGINLRKKSLVSPILFLPLLDYEQFKYIIQVMKIADKERQCNLHEQNEFLHNFFRT